jgi:hypothetical protein
MSEKRATTREKPGVQERAIRYEESEVRERAKQYEKPSEVERILESEANHPLDGKPNLRLEVHMSHKIKAIECVLDWNLWPRHSAQSLDSANIRQMKEAMEAGVTLPAIIVNKDDMRVVDGFHRVSAVLAQYGDEAEIEADVRHYESEAEMFLDAGRYNSIHGLPMSPMDRAYFIIKARRMKIPAPAVAEALGMQASAMKEFLEKRSAMVESTGERIALPYGAAHLATAEHEGQLNEAQEHYARTTDGNAPMFHARTLLKALKANALNLTEKDIAVLKELAMEIAATIKASK